MTTLQFVLLLLLAVALPFWRVVYKWLRWMQSQQREPRPPHSFEVTKVTANNVEFISNWIPHEPDFGIKSRSEWQEWAKSTRAFPL